MCNACNQSTDDVHHPATLPRAAFLRLSMLSGLGTLLSACGIAPQLPSATPTATAVPTAPSLPLTGASPHLAGVLISVAADSLTLRSAVKARNFTLAPDAALYDVSGALLPVEQLATGDSVALWLNENSDTANTLQVLPSLARITVDPVAVPQPEPTGETAPIGALTMLTRAGWGAAEPDLTARAEDGRFDPVTNRDGVLVYSQPLAEVLNTVVIHHSAGSLIDGVREIQRFHMARRGYADIAYHFVIDGFGALFEGRELKVRGTHTGGANTGTVGIVLLGDFNQIPVLRVQLQTAAALTGWLAAQHNITHIAGHRDFQPGVTECPGDDLVEWLPALAAATGLAVGTGGYVVPDWAR